jgi:hypothetical protein
MIEGKVEVCHDRYVTYASVCEFTTTTLEIPFETIKVSYLGRGSPSNLTTRREPISNR